MQEFVIQPKRKIEKSKFSELIEEVFPDNLYSISPSGHVEIRGDTSKKKLVALQSKIQKESKIVPEVGELGNNA